MKKCLFLDRDGVINKDLGYVYKISDFNFNNDIFELVRRANLFDYLVIIITNQSGIARGYYDVNAYNSLTTWMLSQFKKHNCRVDQIYFCPYHPNGIIEEYSMEHWDRKPNPGMIMRAVKDFNVDIEKSILVGDKISDIEAGKNAGIPYNFLFTGLSRQNSDAQGITEITELSEVYECLTI